jgi:formylglycine-generating enzyme required for sulfatase activity
MIKSSIVIIALLSLSVSIVSAAPANIDIGGKIITLNADSITLDSVPYANLFLKNHPEVQCTTDEHGAFRLTNNPNASVRQIMRTERNREPQMIEQKNGLLVSFTGPKTFASIDIFDLSGRLITSAALETREKSGCFIPIHPCAHEVQIVRISISGCSWVFRTISERRAAKSQYLSAKNGVAVLGKREVASFIDTIVVYSKGYKTRLFGIGNYTVTDFIGKIDVSVFWKNCMGPLIAKSGSMIEIKAKDMDFEMGQFCDTIWGKKDGLPTSDLEAPLHTVMFTNNFFIDSTELTQGEYDSLMKATYKGYIKPAWSKSYGMGPDYPVYSVSWDDAILFCNARSKRDHFDTVYTYSAITGTPGSLSKLSNVSADLSKSGYRLPTEAEWEYSCMAGKTNDFFWERDVNYYKQQHSDELYLEANTYAIWAGNSGDLSSSDTNYGCKPVTSMLPNGYDLYGMAGNVSEWCNDWFGKYQWTSATDPTGPASGTSRVIRGGNWKSDIFSLRTTNRYFTASPGVNENVLKGFRTARTAKEEE